jgi:hypothetical protein
VSACSIEERASTGSLHRILVAAYIGATFLEPDVVICNRRVVAYARGDFLVPAAATGLFIEVSVRHLVQADPAAVDGDQVPGSRVAVPLLRASAAGGWPVRRALAVADVADLPGGNVILSATVPVQCRASCCWVFPADEVQSQAAPFGL